MAGVVRVAEVVLYIWRRTDYWRNKCVAGWWTGRHWMAEGCSGWLKSGLVRRTVDLHVHFRTAPQRPCTKISKQIFPEMKRRGLVSNSYIHVSVSDLYIPTIGPPILDLLCEYIKSLTST